MTDLLAQAVRFVEHIASAGGYDEADENDIVWDSVQPTEGDVRAARRWMEAYEASLPRCIVREDDEWVVNGKRFEWLWQAETYVLEDLL